MNPWIRRALSTSAVAAVSLSGLVAFAPASDAATFDCTTLSTPVYNTVNPTVGNQLLTASSAEYKSSMTKYGFTEDHGVLGYGAATAVAGTVPITRMYNATTNDFLWASSSTQIAAAKLYGYVAQKVNFYAPTTSSSCTAGVHKFSKGTHRRNAVSAADQKALLAAGWKDSGVIFYVRTTAPAAAPAPTATATRHPDGHRHSHTDGHRHSHTDGEPHQHRSEHHHHPGLRRASGHGVDGRQR